MYRVTYIYQCDVVCCRAVLSQSICLFAEVLSCSLVNDESLNSSLKEEKQKCAEQRSHLEAFRRKLPAYELKEVIHNELFNILGVACVYTIICLL